MILTTSGIVAILLALRARGLKRTDSPILKGIQIYHNFVRPHEGLNGETPADRAGIKVEGTDKWMTLIQNASKVGRNE
jgi:hypothetical protein